MLKLYIGAPITAISAACSLSTSASDKASVASSAAVSATSCYSDWVAKQDASIGHPDPSMQLYGDSIIAAIISQLFASPTISEFRSGEVHGAATAGAERRARKAR